jgi:hypothetical protein
MIDISFFWFSCWGFWVLSYIAVLLLSLHRLRSKRFRCFTPRNGLIWWVACLAVPPILNKPYLRCLVPYSCPDALRPYLAELWEATPASGFGFLAEKVAS